MRSRFVFGGVVSLLIAAVLALVLLTPPSSSVTPAHADPIPLDCGDGRGTLQNADLEVFADPSHGLAGDLFTVHINSPQPQEVQLIWDGDNPPNTTSGTVVGTGDIPSDEDGVIPGQIPNDATGGNHSLTVCWLNSSGDGTWYYQVLDYYVDPETQCGFNATPFLDASATVLLDPHVGLPNDPFIAHLSSLNGESTHHAELLWDADVSGDPPDYGQKVGQDDVPAGGGDVGGSVPAGATVGPHNVTICWSDGEGYLYQVLPFTVKAPPPQCVGPCKALINLDTVTGVDLTSVEAQLAIADGLTVTEVTGPQWGDMTAAQSAAYQVLIIGDPTCGYLAASATGNRATWAPVVMGTAGGNTLPGNRIVIGTAPVFHGGDHPGAHKLIADGIAFAGALPGRTGVYFDTSCGVTVEGLDSLERLSVGSGAWTANGSPPCGGSVSLIASNVYTDDLNSADLQGWDCSVHETYPTFRSDWSVLAVATDTPTQPVCGSDHDTGAPACGEPYVLLSGVGTVVTAPNISVSPLSATNPQGTDHTVTATVTETEGGPVVEQLVTFTVTGQNNGATGTCSPASCMTNAAGRASFTYHDDNGCGDDTILASFVDPLNSTTQQASASKHWDCSSPTPSPSPPGTPKVFPGTGGGETLESPRLMDSSSRPRLRPNRSPQRRAIPPSSSRPSPSSTSTPRPRP